MKFRSILLIASFILTAAVTADPMDSATLLKKMNAAYAAIKTARMTMESTGYGPDDGKATIDLIYAAPKKLKATLSGVREDGGKVVFTTSGAAVAITDPAGKRPKQETDFDQMRLPWNLETMCFWDYKQQLSTAKGGNMETSTLKVVEKEKWNGKEWIVLEEEAPAQKVSVRYFIDPKTYLIWRTVYTPDGVDKSLESWVTKLELNVKVDEGTFKAGE